MKRNHLNLFQTYLISFLIFGLSSTNFAAQDPFEIESLYPNEVEMCLGASITITPSALPLNPDPGFQITFLVIDSNSGATENVSFNDLNGVIQVDNPTVVKELTIVVKSYYTNGNDGGYHVTAKIIVNIIGPEMGQYPNVTITENQNIEIIPNAPPSCVDAASAYSPGFSGDLLVNPNTGGVSIVNATHPGVYIVEVTGKNGTNYQTSSRTFQVTVNESNDCSSSFNENAITVAPNVKYEKSVIGDFNNDNIQDIAYIEINPDWNRKARPKILLGDGNGGFNSSGTQPPIYDSTNPYFVVSSTYKGGITTGDFDNDGNLDLVTGYRNHFIIQYGNGNGDITYIENVELDEVTYDGFTNAEYIQSLTTGHFNDDDLLDIAVGYYNISNTIPGSSIRLFFGTNNYSFTESISYNSPNNFVKTLKTGNYDADAVDELLVVYDGSQFEDNVDENNEISQILKLNEASNQLEVLYTPNSYSVMGVATGNIDRQGSFDSAVLTRNGIKIFLNNDINNQSASPNYFIPLDVLYNDIQFINKNGDGYIDLIISSSDDNKVTILFGDGSGDFTIALNHSVQQPSSIAVGDFNNDGLQDCVIDNSGVSILTSVNNSINLSTQANTSSTQIGFNKLLYVDVVNTGAENLIIDQESLSLTGPNVDLFTIVGYNQQNSYNANFPLNISSANSAQIVVLFEPTVIGDFSVTLNLAKGDCANPIQTTLITQSAYSNYTGDLGTYPNTTIYAGENIKITPSDAVFNFPKIFATTNTNFDGILSVSPVDGELNITNPIKPGTYIIKISGFVINDGNLTYQPNEGVVNTGPKLFSPTSTTFTLTVLDPICSPGDFETTSTTSIIDANVDNLTAIAIGDFTSNNNQDLIITYSNNTLPTFDDFFNNIQSITDDLFSSSTIQMGYGDGSFDAVLGQNKLMAGFDPRGILIEDYNGDGAHDLAVANSDALGNVFTRAGYFGQLFEIPIKLRPYGAIPIENGNILTPPGASYSKDVDFGDFNNDGIKDLVVVSEGYIVPLLGTLLVPSTVTVLLGDGLTEDNSNKKSHFLKSNLSIVGNGSVSVVAGDFNNDGAQDFATASSAEDKISVRMGVPDWGSILGDLLLESPLGNEFTNKPDVLVSTNPSSIVKGDFNNDGIQDLAVACRGVVESDEVTYNTNGFVSIRLGNGNGGFSECQDCEIEVGLNPSNIKIADFNGDGIEDFAVTNTFSNDISIRFGNGDGSFYGNTQIPVEEGPVKLVVGDFNEDHILDMAVASKISLSILTGASNGALQLQVNGNNTVIPNNDTTPSLDDHTDFDNLEINASSASRTYTIENTGTSSITLNQSDILIEGADASMFSIDSVTYPLFIPAGESVNFDVSFNPSLPGEKTAIIKINISNCITSFTYTFTVKATVVPPPELGNYPNTLLVLGENSSILPDELPLHTLRAVAYTDSNFTGKLLVDPITGIISVTNANQLGTYLVYVQAYTVSDISTTITFELTISSPENCITGFVDTANTDFNATGANPSSVAIGDFNNDGKQDVAIANKDSSFISVKFGNGTDGYSSETTIPILPNTTAIALADFNGDGNLDITAINTTDFRVYNILGNGDGTFEIPIYLNLQYSPTEITVANFNNDGNKDVIITNAVSDNVTIRLGTGTGSFYEEIVVDVGVSPKHVVTANFNNDTFTDFAVVNYADNTVSIHLSNGDGSFSNPTVVAVGQGPSYITVGDFNTDGNQDFATANKDANSISIGLGDGLGGATVSEINTTDAPEIIKVGAFNGDEVLDLITISNSVSDALLKVYNGDGLGSFLESSSTNVCCNISSLAIGDFNTDEITDIALANKDNSIAQLVFGSSAIIKVERNSIAIEDGDTNVSLFNGTDFGRILLGQNIAVTYTIKNLGNSALLLDAGSITVTGLDSNLFSVQSVNLPATVLPGQELSFDVNFLTNSTGIKEATIHIESNDCNVIDYDFKVIAEGAAFEVSSYPTTTSVVSGQTITIQPISNIPPTNIVSATAYIDNTSNTLIFKGSLTVNPITGNITVMNAKPAGTYNVVVKGLQNLTTTAVDTKIFTLTVQSPNCSEGGFVEVQSNLNDNSSGGIAEGDFNNDGITDIATFIEFADENQVIINLGNADGTFQEPQFIDVSNTDIMDISISDFNGDGHQDLLTRFVNYNVFDGTKLYINLGAGDGDFGETITINLSERFENHVVGDFNNDGKQDIILVNDTLTYLLGKGDGSFDLIINDIYAPFANTISAGDFNSDGNLDFITFGKYGRIAVFRNLGNGTFARNYNNDIEIGGLVSKYAMGDFNNDNISDIVVSSEDCPACNVGKEGGFKIYFGDGNANFIAQQAIPIDYNKIESLNVGDFNGDDNQDILLNFNEIIYGNGNGGFTGISSLTEIRVYADYNQAIVGDFNKDGYHDYVSTNSGFQVFLGSSNLNVYSNNLSGEGYNFSNGQTTVSEQDNTYFETCINSSVNQQFTIDNTSQSILNITGISLTGNTANTFSLEGLDNFPAIVSPNSKTTFTIKFSPTTAANVSATLHIYNDDCLDTDFDFKIEGKGIAQQTPPAIAAYSNVSMVTGENIIINPTANVATTALSAIAYTDSNFKGILSVNPSTGKVLVTNAHPAGTYQIFIENLGVCTSATTSFELVVDNPTCSLALFENVPVIEYDAATYTWDSYVADLNEDGIQDLIITDSSYNINIQLGNGDGTFRLHNTIIFEEVRDYGVRGQSIAIGDFNGDGHQDMVTNFNSRLAMYLGDGTGNFMLGNVIVDPNLDSHVLEKADFNNDNNLDIIVKVQDEVTDEIRLVIFLGNGLNGFNDRTEILVDATKIKVGDFNHDGNKDLVFFSGGRIIVLSGDGFAGFTETKSWDIGAAYASGLLLSDFNNDGEQDIAVGVWDSGPHPTYPNATLPTNQRTLVYIGSSNGLFSNSPASITQFINNEPNPNNRAIFPKQLISGDFNADGNQDIVVDYNISSSLPLLLGDGFGGFNLTSIETTSHIFNMAIGDFNTDGRQDIVGTYFGGTSTPVLFGAGSKISITGNNNTIIAASIAPDILNDTDFGVTCPGDSIVKTFTIHNKGVSILELLDGSITINGGDERLFTIGDITLPLSINPNGSATYTITYAPTLIGVATTTINVASNDCNIPIYNFSIAASSITQESEPPVIVCPVVEPVYYTNSNACYTTVDINVTATDNCTVEPVITNNAPLNNRFPVGATTVVFTATDASNNVSTCEVIINVEDNIVPNIECLNSIAIEYGESIEPIDIGSPSVWDNCENTTLEYLDVSYQQTSGYGFSNYYINRFWTLTDDNGNSNTCIQIIQIKDNKLPVAISQNITLELDATGEATITTSDIDNGSEDSGGISSLSLDRVSFSCSDVGVNTVTLTVTDYNSNVSTTTATVTVKDSIPPIVITQDIVVSFDDTGAVTITALEIDNGSFDNCSIASFSLDKTSFSCSDIGSNIVTLTVTDVNGNTSSKDATVIVEEKVAPTVITQNITLELDDTGVATITTTEIDNGSFDNCSIASFSLDKTSFSCSDIGSNIVTLTVTDVNGNTSSKDAIVIVEEKIAPTVITQNITLELDDTGVATITTTDIDNGSFDNCSIASFSLDKTSFSCSDIGSNIVTLTVTDVNGNTSSKDATVIVEEKVAPTVITQNITLELDDTGVATITTTDIDNGSFDNCSIASFSLDKTSFSCSDIGSNIVTLTVTDVNGNTSSKDATVIVEEKVAPTVITQNITLELDDTGVATITTTDIDNGSFDNCSIASFSLDKTSFSCSDIGSNIVTLTVTDINGNTSSKDAIVIVEEKIVPTVITQNITLELDDTGAATISASEIDNGSFDNCSIASFSLDNTSFSCSDIGSNIVTLTVTDVNGNTSSKDAFVIVEEKIAPTVITQNITLELDDTGAATISASEIDNGSFDNCSIASFSLDKTSFSCSDIGSNIVTLTVTDVNGNTSSKDATVIVEEKVAPTVITQNITLELDDTGVATITTTDIDNGSFDNCSIASFSLDKTSFSCSDIGEQTVTLTVTDINGNVSTATAILAVFDNILPQAISQDITVVLDDTGNITITAEDVDNGSNDACGIVSLAIDTKTFNTNDVGENVVTLSVTDINGNVSTVNAIVTIENQIKSLSVFPNPSKGTVNLLLYSKIDTQATVRLIDINGKIIYNGKIQLTFGNNEIELNFKISPSTMLLQVISPKKNYGIFKVIFR
jgi:hypothetical protein